MWASKKARIAAPQPADVAGVERVELDGLGARPGPPGAPGLVHPVDLVEQHQRGGTQSPTACEGRRDDGERPRQRASAASTT